MTWSGPYPPFTRLLARQEIEVKGADLSGVNIAALDLPSVSGQVHYTKIPEDWKAFDISQQRITLIPRNGQAPISAKLSSDGSFRIGLEDVGDYEVNLWIRAPLYISSVRLNGGEIRGRYFHLTAGSIADLEVEVRSDSGTVNFSITPDSSLPVPEPHVDEVCRSAPIWALSGIQVVLLPDPLFADGVNPASSIEKPLFRSSRVSDGKRTFLQITGVPPGKYRAIAAEQLFSVSFAEPNDISREGRALMEALEGQGQPVTVGPSSTQEIALPDKTIDVARLAAKMGLDLDTEVLELR